MWERWEIWEMWERWEMWEMWGYLTITFTEWRNVGFTTM